MIEDAERKGILNKDNVIIEPTPGASLAAISRKIAILPEGLRIPTFNYDTGERYLSTEGLWEIAG